MSDTTPTGRRPTDPAFAAAQTRQQHRNNHPPGTATSDDTTRDDPHPLGRTVWYRSRTGAWTAPAIITATADSLHRPNVDAGHLPDLTSANHVHLTVLTPGIPGRVSDTTAEEHPELADPDRINRPAGGTFQEWDRPFWDPPGPFTFDEQPPGTWTWPR